MAIYTTKQVDIEAIEFTGSNWEELKTFTINQFFPVVESDRGDDPDIIAEVFDILHSTWVGVKDGQFIIKGMKGEFYPCDPEVFHNKYVLKYDFAPGAEVKFPNAVMLTTGEKIISPDEWRKRWGSTRD